MTDDLTLCQHFALAALLRGDTQQAAAAAAGVTDRTLRAWLHDPPFRDALRESRAQLLSATSALVQAAAREAVATMRAVMTDKGVPARARVTAARSLLELGLRYAEKVEYEARITELEEQLEALLAPKTGDEPG